MLGMGAPEKETPQGRDPGNPLCYSVKSLNHQKAAVWSEFLLDSNKLKTWRSVVVIFKDSSVLYRVAGSNNCSLRNCNSKDMSPDNTVSEACTSISLKPGAVLVVQDVHRPIRNIWKLARHLLLHSFHDGQHVRKEEVVVVVRSVETEGEVLRGHVDPAMARSDTTWHKKA